MSYYNRQEKSISINENLVSQLIVIKIEDFLKQQHDNGTNYRDKYFTYDRFISQILENIKEPGFEVRWSMGGKHGHYSGDFVSVSAEPEMDMEDLDKFLLQHYPNIGFLQYKVITHKIDKTTDSAGDYYGGHVDYGVKSLTYEALGDSLVEFGYLLPGKKLNKEEIEDFIKKTYSQDWFKEQFPTKTEAKKLKN